MTLLMLLPAATVVSASEFRTYQRIATPGKVPEGAAPVREIVPIERKVVEQGVQELMGAWNSGDLQDYLGEDFYDKQRLSDTIATYIPRDAELRALAVQNQQTIGQFEKDGVRISKVSVTVQTQIEFNDPRIGYQRIPGTVELIFSIEEDI